mgnify:CR=1 FL=1
MADPVFKVEHRGFTAEAHRVDGSHAHVTVRRDGQPFKEFDYPAYRIWNVAAHFHDMVDEILAPEAAPEEIHE